MAGKKKEEVKEETVETVEESKPETKVDKKTVEAPVKKTAKKAKKGEVKKEAPVEEKTEEAPKKKTTKKAKKEEAPVEEKTKEAPKKKAAKKAKKEDVKEAPAEETSEAPKEEVSKTPADKITEEAPAEEKKEKKTKKKAEPKEEGPFPEDLIFGRFNTREVVVEDPSLKAFINLDPAYVPHSSSRHANKPFHKHKISIVERLINNMMRTEKYTGKKTKSYKAVLDALVLIESRMKENPVQVLVRAIEYCAPREEVTRLKFGGISVPKSVDTAPARRLDIALRNISIGTVKSSHKNRKTIAECLAGELIAASKGDIQSYAVSKRDEMERVAKSAH